MTTPKSSKQRRAEMKVRRKVGPVKRAAKLKADLKAFRIPPPPGGSAPVKKEWLVLAGSYRVPEFIGRGYYLDQEFVCNDCGKPEVWTAAQQKWWYEVAGGYWVTTAIRCRPCRRIERKRAADHKQRSEEGKLRKAARK